MSALGDTVLQELAGGVSTITLNRPDAANALTADQRDVVIDLLEAADRDPEVRVVVVRSNGRHFCSGADVAGIAAGRAGMPNVGDAMRRIMHGAQRLIAAVLDCPKPVVAVVQGPAAGLGAHLAFACDLVVASEDAYFLEPFLSRGIVVDAGGAYLLPRLVGLQRAKELAFLAQKVPAAEAERIGLVNRVVSADQLDAAAAELVGRLAVASTTALSLTKRLFNHSFDSDRSASFLAEAMSQELAGGTTDAKEGVAAFMERRPPQFRGH
jgi:2-(1,2-epoxy-1,2-dihydrophenyl)acetyl-CoA isomerase